MEVTGYFETLVTIYQTTRRRVSEDSSFRYFFILKDDLLSSTYVGVCDVRLYVIRLERMETVPVLEATPYACQSASRCSGCCIARGSQAFWTLDLNAGDLPWRKVAYVTLP
jgi:hypothetical protein